MAINSKYKNGFISQIEASQRGEVTFIPNPLDRVGDIFNLMQSRYVLISGATGAGKTSYADYNYILAPWSMKEAGLLNDIYWEVNYFSLERKQMFKHAKWVSWMMYRDDNKMLLSADEIMGWKSGPLNTEGYNLVRSYDDEMSSLLEHVHIHDGKVSASTVSKIITRRALELGDLFKSDEDGVLFRDNPVYIERFDDKNLLEQTKTGPRKYIELTHNNVAFRIYQDDHRYFMNNPRSFVFFVIDGINLLGDKGVIDDISVELADARDIYGFSPVVVTQQNRAMGDIQRMKLHGNDLSPQLEDIFKSSQMGFDADLVLGLFDPYRYKAFDKTGSYDGYCLKPMDITNNSLSMRTPNGVNRFRSLHILKNTFGADGGKFGMKFLGECNHFETLPFPDNDVLMQKVYLDIRQGL